MISLILILAIVGQAFAFPATDVTETKTEQQGSPLYQIPKDSQVHVQEEKKEIQNPQVNVDQQEKVQNIQTEIKSNYEAEANQVAAQSTIEEPKISQQVAPEISKVSESVQEYSNAQLLQLKPVTPDAVLVSNLQQPVLLPYIATGQIQPLSVIPVEQVDNINQKPIITTQEVANLVIIPAFESAEQSNVQNQIPYESSVQSPDAQQQHLNIIQPKIGQVGAPTVDSHKPVEATEAQNVNHHQTFQQKEKQVEGIQEVLTPQGKTNTEPADKAEQQVNQEESSSSTQYENVPQGNNVAHYYLNKNIPYGEKIEQQSNQGQAVIPTQYQKTQGGEIARYQIETNSHPQDKYEQQVNEGQASSATQYENAPQGSNVAQYHLNKNIPYGEKIDQQLNQGQEVVLTQYQQGHYEQVPYQQKVQSHVEPRTEEQSNQHQFNIKEEIQKAQEEFQQEALNANPVKEQYSQETSKVES